MSPVNQIMLLISSPIVNHEVLACSKLLKHALNSSYNHLITYNKGLGLAWSSDVDYNILPEAHDGKNKIKMELDSRDLMGFKFSSYSLAVWP